MNRYLADLHIHSVLSPCGDLSMSPRNIIAKALEKKLDIIGISDHNSTLQARTVKKMGEEKGLFVLCGAEISSREDIHCLAFFKNLDLLDQFQSFLEEHLIKVPNNVDFFGEQLIVDEDENIISQIEFLLGSSLDVGIEEVEVLIHSLEGLMVPSHINRPRNSLLSQLGFIPHDFKADALEIDRKYYDPELLKKHPEVNNFTLLRNSDAHQVDAIGSFPSAFLLEMPSFEEIKMALRKENGRRVEIDF